MQLHREGGLDPQLGITRPAVNGTRRRWRGATGFLFAACIAGCGGGSDDVGFNRSQISEVSEDGGDRPGSSALTWTRPSSSQVNCVRAPCPSIMLDDVNSEDKGQLVYLLDWRALKLSESAESDAASNPSTLLLYGRYTSATALGEPVRIFQITRANVRVSENSRDNPQTDLYYSVVARNEPCPQQPCPAAWRATLLKLGAQPELWSAINLNPLQLPPDREAGLVDELKAGKAYLSVSRVTEQGGAQVALSTQAFRPIKSSLLP